jgi:hypothetical protein
MPVVKEGRHSTTDDDDKKEDNDRDAPNWKCLVCGKVFESNYILNYHNLLEHSKYKRPPIGIS